MLFSSLLFIFIGTEIHTSNVDILDDMPLNESELDDTSKNNDEDSFCLVLLSLLLILISVKISVNILHIFIYEPLQLFLLSLL